MEYKYTAKSVEDSGFGMLFNEITECGNRPWNEKNKEKRIRIEGEKYLIFSHPEYPDCSILDFRHFYEFLEFKIGYQFVAFQSVMAEDHNQRWGTFYRGQYRVIGAFKVQMAFCTAAQFLEIELILLIAEFLKDCEIKNIRLFFHAQYEETINCFLRDAPQLVTQLQSNNNQKSTFEQTTADNHTGFKRILDEAKWLDPNNYDALPLKGREKELKLLDEFIQIDRKFQIWTISGPSGAGKTRLVSEWTYKSPLLKNWALILLHKEDRFDLDRWNNWLPDKSTLIVIDYMYGFEEVIQKLMKNRNNSTLPYVRLLVIDHIFSDYLPSDKHWGLTGGMQDYNKNEDFFFKTESLDLSQPNQKKLNTEFIDSKEAPNPDQQKIIKEIIAHRADIKLEDNQVGEAHDYLWEMQGAYYPLFAALVGDAIKLRKNFKELNRRQLIDYYLSGSDRLPWEHRVADTGELSVPGRWASYFIAVATARREMSYRDLIDTAANCISSSENHPKVFDEAKEICQKVVTDNNAKFLKPFEPDILGESFFLKLLHSLENSPTCQKEFRQIFMAGNAEKHAKDAIEFIAFIQRLTRNLLNDNQKDVETLWEVLFDFLKPSEFKSSEFLQWAVTATLIDVANAIKDRFPEEVSNLLNKIESSVLNKIKNDELFEEALIYSMHYFELIYQSTETVPEIPEEMAGLFRRFTAMSAERERFTPLIIASFEKFNKIIKAILLDSNVNTEASIIEGQNALMVACAAGHTDTARILLERGTNIEATDYQGRTALMYASVNDHTDTIRFLLGEDANIEATDNEDITTLMYVSMNGNIDAVRLLLDGGVDIEAADNQGRTALMYASRHGHIDSVRLLLDGGADIKVTGNEGRTALIYASVNGHTDAVRLLLDGGANIEGTGHEGRTALIYASINGHTDAVRLLLDEGANMEATDNEGRTALMYASKYGYTDTVKLLLDGGANMQVTDNEGRTALMYASINDRPDTVRLLLEEAINIEATDNDGRTALMYASVNDRTDTVRLLLEEGANIDAADNEGLTALMYASLVDHTDTVRLLLDGGANIDVSGHSALSIAKARDHQEIIQLLIDHDAKN